MLGGAQTRDWQADIQTDKPPITRAVLDSVLGPQGTVVVPWQGVGWGSWGGGSTEAQRRTDMEGHRQRQPGAVSLSLSHALHGAGCWSHFPDEKIEFSAE